MIEFLQLAGIFSRGGTGWYSDIGFLFQQWEQYGVFAYVLPGLLIFALVYGVLSSVKFFGKNRGVDAIIALAVALLSLQFDFVPAFFREIFPRAGVGIAIVLTFLILMGLFIPWEAKWPVYIFMGVTALVAIIIVGLSFSSSTYPYSWSWFSQYGAAIVIGVIVLIAILAIVLSGGKEKTTSSGEFQVPLTPLWHHKD